MRRITSLLLAAALLVGMALPAFASDVDDRPQLVADVLGTLESLLLEIGVELGLVPGPDSIGAMDARSSSDSASPGAAIDPNPVQNPTGDDGDDSGLPEFGTVIDPGG